MNRMTHPIKPEEVMAHLDGELAADRATVAAAHLRECAECQGLAAELGSVSQNLKTWKVEQPEPAIPQAITNALAGNRAAARNVFPAQRNLRELWHTRWARVMLAGAAAAVFLVGLGTLKFEGGRASSVFSRRGAGVDKAVVNKFQTESRLEPSPPPPPPPINGRIVTELAQLQPAPPATASGPPADTLTTENNLSANGPMIIRTAQLNLITKEFDTARANLEAILKRHQGYIGELNAGGDTGSGRTLTATLRVPADQVDATLAEVKTLGRVESESQGGQDVTSQYVDLEARLGNARNTEERLTDLLRNRTGKLSDVLAVEQELDRVRGEIEQMEAERKNMAKQVSYATLTVTIAEEYTAQLQVVPPSTSNRLGNAAIEGYRNVADGVVAVILFLLTTGPSLLLWAAILFFPARVVWKKLRRSLAA
ncbi:MAG TPA: DUF4349 domain-containing protein [Terriglobales bacterium]